ncbi:nuclear transport factor 2-like isoform X1 [Magnolia sinica]|uniref:nuclear transport factor 2-like isoform X1 n=2 Tax=Magnolia sinica TaxID=86752 RepID=UPI00265A4B35|nr:nuclear transport factor 2-like isoform X1 [Magnolia sinica]
MYQCLSIALPSLSLSLSLLHADRRCPIEARDLLVENYICSILTEEMASQTASPPSPAAPVVCNAFVEQYYHILHQSPESVYRFYQDSSMLSRPEPTGVMTLATTVQAINEKILSLNSTEFKAEIKTADAQESHNGGVIVLVTGFLTGLDEVRRKFTQTFFLAPQDKGFFVLNDIFRYMDENESIETSPVLANGISENAPSAPLTPVPEPAPALDRHLSDPVIPLSEEDLNNGEEVCDPSDHEDSVGGEEGIVDPAALSIQNEVQPIAESASLVQVDAPKKSYASIVKVMKESAAPRAVYVPTATVWMAPASTEQQSLASAAPPSAPETPTPSDRNAPESSNIHEEAEGHSIYIRGLPLNATVLQLEEEFKKFGPIRTGGVQVRSNKQQGFCFGFVEFESSSSMHSAIEASPIMLGGRQAFVEEKKTTSRASGSGRGRFPPGRGGFRSDSFRSRGSFGGGRGYGRGDFGGRGDFSGRGRGPSGRSGESYQRVDQNGNSRVGRPSGMNQTVVSS